MLARRHRAAQGHKAVLFGVPDCGKVCSEAHVPSFLRAWDELRRHGITRILCVAVGDPAAADAWAQRLGAGVADGSKVTVAADANGAFTRFLGMEQGAVDAAGPRSLRYAAVVDDGTLLKVVRRVAAVRGAGDGLRAHGPCCWLARCRHCTAADGLLPPRSRQRPSAPQQPWLTCLLALAPPPAPLDSAWTRRQRRPRRRARSRSSRCSRPCTDEAHQRC